MIPIAPANPAHHQAIARIWNDACNAMTDSHTLDITPRLPKFNLSPATGATQAGRFAVDGDGNEVGYVIASAQGKSGWIDSIAVEPATQRAGAGKHRLFASAPDYATKDVVVDVPTAGEVPVRVVLPTTKVKLEIKQIAILDKVYFETNSDVIKGESFDLLNEVASVIMSHPEIGRVEVQGHTDSDGSDAFNLELSERRAQSVRRYLEGRGVEAGRLQAKGYGETLPLQPNTSAAGKAKNRRVEFKLVDAPADSAVKEAPKK